MPRNPRLTRADLEGVLGDYLGVRKVLWLGRGVAGVEKNAKDVNHVPLQENLHRLQGMTSLQGRPLEIVTLPMPAPVFFKGQRLPASYANFYIANDRVLVPTFNDPNDRLALGILAEQFPGRIVVGIHSVDLVWGLGTLHCLTQQQPKP